tara:strand:+ start:5947 stop:6372 length:426 start_codon:yes stop_codon:yes gene_type:complete
MWTDAKEADLRRLWGEGHSANTIAEQIEGATRNSVIGKASRLGLEGRPSPIIRDGRPRRVAKRPPKPKRKRKAVSRNMRLPTGSQVPRDCRYIYGDPGIDPDGWRYCSRPVAPRGETPAKGKHGVYCIGHLPIMYKKKETV